MRGIFTRGAEIYFSRLKARKARKRSLVATFTARLAVQHASGSPCPPLWYRRYSKNCSYLMTAVVKRANFYDPAEAARQSAERDASLTPSALDWAAQRLSDASHRQQARYLTTQAYNLIGGGLIGASGICLP